MQWNEDRAWQVGITSCGLGGGERCGQFYRGNGFEDCVRKKRIVGWEEEEEGALPKNWGVDR